MQHVLIVEDITEVARALRDTVLAAFDDARIEGASSVAEGRSRLRERRWDIALIDLGLPDGSGIELVHELAGSCTQVVVTTIFDDDEHLFEALRAGATGYLLKDEQQPVLIDLLRGINEGRPPLSATIARRILHFFRPPAPRHSILSPRETEVLTLTARGYTARDVAETLGMSQNTAAGHLKSIYQKLAVNSRAEAAIKAVQLGIVR
ncbi:MAG: response regulator [Gammaproteobacteria bacterium]